MSWMRSQHIRSVNVSPCVSATHLCHGVAAPLLLDKLGDPIAERTGRLKVDEVRVDRGRENEEGRPGVVVVENGQDKREMGPR